MYCAIRVSRQTTERHGQLQNKGVLIDMCFKWNDSGVSCTMQKGLHILCENISYADIKGKAILV